METDENSAMLGTDCQPNTGFYVAGEAVRDMPGLRSGGRMHDTKYTSSGEVVPTSRAFVPRRDHRSGLRSAAFLRRLITPVIHGWEIDENSGVLGTDWRFFEN